MAFQLNIDDIVADASVGGYDGIYTLSSTTTLTLLSVLSVLYDMQYWTNDIDDIDDDDIEVIDVLMSLANFELMFNTGLPSTMTVGTTFLWFADTVPTDTLECDGSQYLKATYPELSSLLGAEYSVDASNFVVPDLRDRLPIGAGTRSINDSGGEEEVTLTTDEIPSHSHFYSSGLTVTQLVTNPPPPAIIGRINGDLSGVPLVNSIGVNVTGGDDAHNNMPPFLTCKFVIQAVS